MCASGNGHIEVVDTLLQHGARVDLKDKVRNYIHSLSHYMHVMHIKLVLRILTLNIIILIM